MTSSTKFVFGSTLEVQSDPPGVSVHVTEMSVTAALGRPSRACLTKAVSEDGVAPSSVGDPSDTLRDAEVYSSPSQWVWMRAKVTFAEVAEAVTTSAPKNCTVCTSCLQSSPPQACRPVVTGSSPRGHCRKEQSTPTKPASHTHAWRCLASHSLYSKPRETPEWSTLPSKLAVSLLLRANWATSARGKHTPLPEHPFGQAERWHACPVYPSKQVHWPVARSHCPFPEHSV